MSDTELEATADAEFDEAAEVVDESPVKGETPTRRNGVAWLALLLAAMALGIVGYTVFENWMAADESIDDGTAARLDQLERRADRSEEAVASVDEQIKSIEHPDFGGDIEVLERDVDGRLQMLDSLPSRMTTLENSVSSLAGISAGARETFLLAEAEYYLQIANAQLQLANNPHLAGLALGMADERVVQLSDPGLTAVRRAISNELRAMEVMQKPDIEGATLTLASLASVVNSLPLKSSDSDDESRAFDPDQGSIDRAWSSVKDALSGLVKITPPDQAALAMVSPDSEFFLRNNMALQLQAARLALLRGEQAIFEQTLDDTSALLNTYFDVSSEQVTGAQLTISEIRNSVFTVSMPDISESLRLLRQYRTLRETSE